MRAVILQVPESLLAERRRTGVDRFDEMWNGVLHMVPAPSFEHQSLGFQLASVLAAAAEARALRSAYEANLYRPGTDRDYRVPDLVFARPENVSARGVEGRAELVIELLSPDDETYDKLPFYAELGVQEVLVIDPPSRRVELFVLREGKLLAVVVDEGGWMRSKTLGVTFRTVEGPKLEVSRADGSTAAL